MSSDTYFDFEYPKAVEPVDGYTLLIEFADGSKKHFDVEPYFTNKGKGYAKHLAPLREQALFRQVFIDGPSVGWPGNIGIAPEEIWHNSRP